MLLIHYVYLCRLWQRSSRGFDSVSETKMHFVRFRQNAELFTETATTAMLMWECAQHLTPLLPQIGSVIAKILMKPFQLFILHTFIHRKYRSRKVVVRFI